MNYYVEMLKKSIARVEADFVFSASIDHNASKGAFREQIVKKLLRPFLPGAYGISSGQAFDQDGNMSKQLDVVIYDAIYSYIAPYSDDFVYFPCESVFGNIEVKSKLDKQSLYAAMENIESLKQLKREKVDTFYVNPMKPLKINNITWDIQATNEYFGVIFAYESSISDKKILEHIKEAVDNGLVKRENIPNFIVLFKEKKIIKRYQRDSDGMFTTQPLKDFNGLVVFDCDDNVLSNFIVSLLITLRSITFKTMDIVEMSKQVSEEILSGKSGKINSIVL